MLPPPMEEMVLIQTLDKLRHFYQVRYMTLLNFGRFNVLTISMSHYISGLQGLTGLNRFSSIVVSIIKITKW